MNRNIFALMLIPNSGLYVHGGQIEAHGGKYAAGIGGGQDEHGIDVTVYDGSVWASGGTDAAGQRSPSQRQTHPERHLYK